MVGVGGEGEGGMCVLRLADPVSVFLDWVGEGGGEVEGREGRGRVCVCAKTLCQCS